MYDMEESCLSEIYGDVLFGKIIKLIETNPEKYITELNEGLVEVLPDCSNYSEEFEKLLKNLKNF